MRQLVYAIDDAGGDVTVQLRCKNANYVARSQLKKVGAKTLIKPLPGTKTDWSIPDESEVYHMTSMADQVDDDMDPTPVTYEVTVWQAGQVVREESANGDLVRIRAKEFPGADAAVYISAELTFLAS